MTNDILYLFLRIIFYFRGHILSNPLSLVVRREKAKFIYKDFLLVSVLQNEKENELFIAHQNQFILLIQRKKKNRDRHYLFK